MKKLILAVFCFSLAVLAADEITLEPEISQLNRSETFSKESIGGMSDPYLEGYLQSLIDMNYYEYKVIVVVKDHKVWLANLPKNKMLSNSITAFMKDVPGVDEVSVIEGKAPQELKERQEKLNRPKINGIWFPQNTELFLPLIANPRQAIYAVAYRGGGNNTIGTNDVAIALGDDFPIFRWLNVFPWEGDLQIGIEGGIWSIFNVNVKGPNPNGGTELVNTDFYVGFPITYAINKWSYRLRGFHLSSHLGDEFMVNHPEYKRKNPSYEAIDFFVSYQAGSVFRLFVGPGFILHSDHSFPMKRGYAEYGFEARFLGHSSYYHGLYGTFFASAYWRNWQFNNWLFDGTYALGYEWSKLQGVGRKIRLFASLHHGFCPDGQFMRERVSYGTLTFAYGF